MVINFDTKELTYYNAFIEKIKKIKENEEVTGNIEKKIMFEKDEWNAFNNIVKNMVEELNNLFKLFKRNNTQNPNISINIITSKDNNYTLFKPIINPSKHIQDLIKKIEIIDEDDENIDSVTAKVSSILLYKKP